MRGLAAAAVMLHHNLYATQIWSPAARQLIFLSPFQFLVTGRPAVLFFFVLSGFVLARVLRNFEGRMTTRIWLAWCVQRSIRLLLPVAAAVAVSAFLYELLYSGQWPGESPWLATTLWSKAIKLGPALSQALLLEHSFDLDNVLWSLVHEWRISMVIPAIAATRFLRGAPGGLTLLLIGLVAAGLAADPWVTGSGGPQDAVGFRSSFYFLLPFAIGAALALADLSRFRPDWHQLATGVLAAACLVRMNADLATCAASAILIWLAIQESGLRTILLTPVLQWLGRVSFSLYLVHELVLLAVHHRLHDVLGANMLFAVGCAGGLVAAELFYRLFERPSHHLARWAWTALRTPGRLVIPFAC